MKRTIVNSSNLAAVDYDRDKMILEIEFNSGSVYRYSRVPESIYIELMQATSHGRYFYANIRDIFPYERTR